MEQLLKRAVLMRPGKNAEVVTLDVSDEGLEKLVKGFIEVTYPFSEPICFVSNECAKIDGLPLNRSIRDSAGKIYDIYAGVVVAVRENEDGELEDLTDTDVQMIMDKFGEAEHVWKKKDLSDDALISMNGKTEVISDGPFVTIKFGVEGLQ